MKADNILEAISDFSNGCQLLQNKPECVRMRSGDVLKQIDTMHDVIRRDPFSNSTALAMTRLLGLLNMLQGHSDVSAVEIRIQHRTIMLSLWAAYSWVMTLFSHADDTWDDEEIELFWATRLIRKVTTAVMGMMGKRSQVKIDPQIYIPGLEAEIYTFTPSDWCPDGREQFVGEDQARPFAIIIVFDIIRSWMGYPRDDLSFARYCFCDILLNAAHFEPAVFLLDCVWKAYSFPRTYILQNSKQRSETINMDTFRTLADALSESPMTKAESYEYRLLQELESVSDKWQVLTRQAVHPPRRTQQAIADSHPSPVTVDDTPLERYLQFYRHLIPLLDPSFQPTTVLQQEVHSNRDFLLPFRMQQPSLQAVQQPGGLYTAHYLRTRAGMFGELILRGITYGSPAGRSGTGVYPSLEAWQRYKRQHANKGDAWLCNQRAYGPCIKDRTPSNASIYWKSSALLLDKVQDQNTTFTSLWNFVSGKDFPGIGELIGFLLCGDLAHQGLIPLPSAETIGEAVHKLNKGGVRGLQDLDLVPQKPPGRKGDRSQITGAFSRLYKYMDIHLTQQEKDRTAFSTLVLENGLCKYHRCLAWL
jgi:hypothetical protein